MNDKLTNPQRSDRTEQMLARYSDDAARTNLVDLLADAMHWCQANGHDFASILGTAQMHFETEVANREGVEP
jgi:hypothetical protein